MPPCIFSRGIEEEGGDHRILADVLGDILLCIVRAHLFLVDVFLEDVSEDIGIDFIVFLERALVEMPLVGIKEFIELLKRPVGDRDGFCRCSFSI